MPHAILRPSLIAGAENAVLTMLVRMIRFAPVIPVIGDGLYQLQPIAADDIGEVLAVAVERPAIQGTFEVAGPEKLTYHQLLDALERALGVSRKRIAVPVAMARAGAMAGTLVPMVSPISPSQLTMLLEGNTTEHNAASSVFGVTPRPFDDVAREMCAAFSPAGASA